MTRRFAEDTSVPIERSRAEIEALLTRYGCDDIASRIAPGVAMIQFEVHDRRIRFAMRLPAKDDSRFTLKKVNQTQRTAKASPEQAQKAWEQECRRLWRALALSIKAKLEAVQSGIAEFESEFLANVVDPHSGKTVAELIRPQLAERHKGLPAPDDHLTLDGPNQRKGSDASED